MKRRHKILELDGVRYYKKPDGYYRAAPSVKIGYYHRDLWEKHFGPIPDGMHVHHLDHDKENNDINNYALMTAAAHAKLHYDDRIANGWKPELSEEARAKCAAWHSTPEGLEWHRQHGAATWDARVPQKLTCAQCGSEFEGFFDVRGDKTGPYCRPYCRAKARKLRGEDGEDRTCPQCGSTFRVDKYTRKQFCTKECAYASRRK